MDAAMHACMYGCRVSLLFMLLFAISRYFFAMSRCRSSSRMVDDISVIPRVGLIDIIDGISTQPGFWSFFLDSVLAGKL